MKTGIVAFALIQVCFVVAIPFIDDLEHGIILAYIAICASIISTDQHKTK